MTRTPCFEVLPGARESPVVLHVPHAARAIPPGARASIILDDDALASELGHMTDAHTDVLAQAAASRADPRPWQFVNRCSRLVVDPERFPDEREEMLAVGMGAVYSRTSHGHPLRTPDPERDASFLAAYFSPYAGALADLVDQRLAATSAAVILDVHSYPRHALPYERHADLARPAICLGTDVLHTPAWLIRAAEVALAGVGEVGLNTPFIGTYVPLRHYETDRRVQSIMVEIRRDAYCEPDGSLSPRWEEVSAALGQLTDAAARGVDGRAWSDPPPTSSR